MNLGMICKVSEVDPAVSQDATLGSEDLEIQNVTIEKSSLDDLQDIVRIESESFKDPWPESIIIKDILNDNLFVAKVKGKVIGYISIEKILDEVHIQNIAVDKKFRRKGIGSLLIRFAIDSNPGCSFFLEVRRSNSPAISLYKKFGFHEVGIRKNYYGDEDAIVMAKQKKEDG